MTHITSTVCILRCRYVGTAPSGPGFPQYRSFMITLRDTTLGRTPLVALSARRLSTYNTHTRMTSMPRAGFETALPGRSRPQIRDLYSAATGIGIRKDIMNKITLYGLVSISSKAFQRKNDDIPYFWALQNCTGLSDFTADGSIAPT